MYSGDYRNYANDSADNRNNHFSCSMVMCFKPALRIPPLDLDETLGHEKERGQDTTEGFYLSSLKSLVLINLSAPVFQSELRYSYGAPRDAVESDCCISSCAFATSKALKPPATTLTTTCTTRSGMKTAGGRAVRSESQNAALPL